MSYTCILIWWFMVFNATFNNISVISWRSVLLVEESGGPGENHRPVASHWQTLSHNVVLSTPHHAYSTIIQQLKHPCMLQTFYHAIVWCWVLIVGVNKLKCYLVVDLIALAWYLIHVERTVWNGNSTSTDVKENTLIFTAKQARTSHQVLPFLPVCKGRTI